MTTVIIAVKLHEGDMELINVGKLDFGKAVENSLNHGHSYEVLEVEED